MSKQLACSENELKDIFDKMFILMKNKNLSQGKVKFEYALPDLQEKANIRFSPLAWVKILSLVSAFDKEIQWHGLVEQINENTWRISDIILFPHDANEITVISEQIEYQNWLNNLDDETFYQVRFHGHSHNNMTANPSDFDMIYRTNMLQNIPSTDRNPYYIFMIMNKNKQITIEIYDRTKNIVYTNQKDINIIIETNDITIDEFVKTAKRLTDKPKPEKQFNKQHKKHKQITTNDEKILKSNFFNNSYDDKDYYCINCRDFDCMNCLKC